MTGSTTAKRSLWVAIAALFAAALMLCIAARPAWAVETQALQDYIAAGNEAMGFNGIIESNPEEAKTLPSTQWWNTQDNFDELSEALIVGNMTLDNSDATQEQVDDATSDIVTALINLTFTTQTGRIHPVVNQDPHFADVLADAWYAEDVDAIASMGFMTGYAGTDDFAPMGSLTRAEAAVILNRYAFDGGTDMSEKPANTIIIPNHTWFEDVQANTWYTQAVDWAFFSGVMSGYDGSYFGPYDPLTREQLCVILHNFAVKYGAVSNEGADSTAYQEAPDAASVSNWAKPAVAWAYANKVMTGNSETHELDPQGVVTRAQAAKMFTYTLRDLIGW